MRQQYKAFRFDGQTYHEDMSSGFKLINATLDNDFYMQCIRGPRTIIEDKIPGRDIPYFYEIDDEPLEFEVTFAFTEYMTKTQIKAIARKLFSPTTYKELTFGDYVSSTYTAKTPVYKVIFHGETDINYVQGANDTYIAYFTLSVRSDRPYGYNAITAGDLSAAAVSTLSITNTGDINFDPRVEITAVATTSNWIRVRNGANGSTVTFKGLTNTEAIVVSSTLKTITSTYTGVYTRWNKDDLSLDAGSNTFTVQQSSDSGANWTTYSTGVKLKVSGEAPVYIYDTN